MVGRAERATVVRVSAPSFNCVYLHIKRKAFTVEQSHIWWAKLILGRVRDALLPDFLDFSTRSLCLGFVQTKNFGPAPWRSTPSRVTRSLLCLPQFAIHRPPFHDLN